MPDPINQQLPDPQALVDNALAPEPQVEPATPPPAMPPVPEPVMPEPVAPEPVMPEAPMPSAIPVGDDTPLAFVKETQASIPQEQPTSSPTPPVIPPPPEAPKKKGVSKVLAMIVGVITLIVGLGAFGYYYLATPPQISNISEWTKAECTNGCSPAGYATKWTTLRGCIATETRCGSAAPTPDPTSCEEVNKNTGGAECLPGNPSIGENCDNKYSRVGKSGNCYKANQICCGKALNTKGDTGGGTGYIGKYCDNTGCDVKGAPGCYVTHYTCQQSGVGNCNETTVAHRVQSAKFTETCGTEQIDVTCTNPDNSIYKEGSSSKSYGPDCREPSSPRPSDRATPTPTPSPGVPTMACTALTRVPTTTPEVGDTMTFTCAGSVKPSTAGTLSYKFRYSLNSGAYAALANTTATTAELEIEACGTYEVQCQACATLNGKLTCDPVWTGATQ